LIDFQNIINLEIENSSICNAACPSCLRETEKGNYKWFTQTYLPLSIFQKIPDSFYNKLQKILFSGTMGDPCAAPNILEVCEYVRSKSPEARIVISTNGGMKDPLFWKTLPKILKEKSEVVFAIDGLENTNDIYRMNVSWNKLMANCKSFIEAGGNASWQFIIFNHNQHQVEQAKDLAKKLGFKNFISRPSHRFVLDEILEITRYGKNQIPILPPSDNNYVHKVVFYKSKNKETIQSLLSNSNNTFIECFVKKDKSIYIDATGNIFPCCFLAASLYSRKNLNVEDGWNNLWNLHGKDKINLHKNNFKDIIESSFFSEIENSWSKDYFSGRLAVCAGTCSNFNGRFNNPYELDSYEKIK
jgi:MoaA/NifB/PqqE/SkfB family radical SAM enzyme